MILQSSNQDCSKYLLHNSLTGDVSIQVCSLPRTPGLTECHKGNISTRLNSPVPKDAQSQISARLKSLVIKATQAIKIATQVFSQTDVIDIT